MTDKEIYENAYSTFVPAPEDAVDNVPFYRSWAALKALLKSYGFEDPYAAPINAHQRTQSS